MNGLEQFPRDEVGRLILPDATLERFWWYVDRRGEDQCWEWIGARSLDNYGTFCFMRSPITAHRMSYLITERRDIPTYLCVCHRCDYRPCVNPAHLHLLSRGENNTDRTIKGRSKGSSFLNDPDLLRPVDYKSIGPMAFTVAERFWNNIQKSEGCWLWTGHRAVNGYGTLGDRTKVLKAHRLSWELHHGAIPAGLHVMHTCDIRVCVNPAHLRLGTHADNMADMKTKGRGRSRQGDEHWSRTHPEKRASGSRNGMIRHPESRTRGERNHFSTLTLNQAFQAIARYGSGESAKAIAGDLQVTPSCLHRLFSGLSWMETSAELEAARVQALIHRSEQEHRRIQNIRQARLSGATVREICTRFNVASGHVKTWTADLQIDHRRKPETSRQT